MPSVWCGECDALIELSAADVREVAAAPVGALLRIATKLERWAATFDGHPSPCNGMGALAAAIRREVAADAYDLIAADVPEEG